MRFLIFKNSKVSSILSLFASSSTLVCCALPILLSSLGFGSIILGLVDSMPFLITFTGNKDYTFIVVFVLLVLNYWWIYKKKKVAEDCQIIDSSPEQHKQQTACEVGATFNKLIFKISVSIYGVGFFFAYLVLPIYRWWVSVNFT